MNANPGDAPGPCGTATNCRFYEDNTKRRIAICDPAPCVLLLLYQLVFAGHAENTLQRRRRIMQRCGQYLIERIDGNEG